MTVVARILSKLNSVLILCPFLCIRLVLRDMLAALPDLNTMDVKVMTLCGWAALGLAVGGFLLYSLALLFSHPGASHTTKNTQPQVLHHLAPLPLGLSSQNSSDKLRKIIRENATQTGSFLAHQLPDMTGSAVTAVAVLVMPPFFDWRLGGLSILLLIAGFMVQMLMISEKSTSYMRKYQDASEQMDNEAVGYVRGIPVIKAFQQVIYSSKNFYAAIMYYKGNVTGYALSCQGPTVVFNVIINAPFAMLISAGILLIGLKQYNRFLLDLILYILSTPGSADILNGILLPGTCRMMAQEAVRQADSLLAETSVVEDALTRILGRNGVESRDVTFTYPGTKAPALFHLSFQVLERKTVALVGASGGGKATAATLIPRFWDVQGGAVCVGDVPVSQISKQELMNRITSMLQGSQLLKASILENVRASRPDAAKEQAVETLRSAQYDDILEELPKGVDTVLGTKGIYLSGGEQQYIAPVRTILRDAPIVLLDEATAFVGPENEHRIQMVFKRLTQGKTVLMIARRLPTIQNVDEILVLEQDIVVE